jgi:hypothetical protein
MSAKMIHNMTDIGTGDLGYYGESPCSWRVDSWGNGRLYLVHENGTSTKSITTQEAADQNWLWWREERR